MSSKSKFNQIKSKLLKQNIDISEFSKLHLACAFGFTHEINKLIKINQNLNLEDNFGLNPLIITSMLGYSRLLELLIQNGANVNQANKYGVTPLHMAAYNGNVEIVKILIKYGANKNAETEDDITPSDLIKKKYFPNYLKIDELLK